MSEEFKQLYWAAYKKELERLKLLDKKDDLDRRIDLLQTCLEAENETLCPFLVGTQKERISILSLGNDNPADKKEFEKLIYYVGFKSRRKVSLDDKKVNVTCEVTEEGPKITTDGKKEWKGEKCWDDFYKEVDCVYDSNWLEFFGISSEKYQKAMDKREQRML